MTLTADVIRTHFRAARAVLACSTVSVRHNGRTYSGVRSSVEYSDQPGGMGALQGAEGAVRLDVSELRKPYPKAGDVISIKEPDSDEWKERRVILPRYDQGGGTVRLDYGERDG